VLLAVHPEFADRVPDGVRTVDVVADLPAWRETPAEPRAHVSAPSDVVAQPYTSGTTSMPKGVLLTNANYGAILSVSPRLRMREGTTVLAVMPVFHIGGIVFSLYALHQGGTLIVRDAFHPAELPALVAEHAVTHITLVPAMVGMLVDAHPHGSPDLATLTAIVYGGAPITSKEYDRAVGALGVPLIQAYGMSECPAISSLAATDHHDEFLRSVGRAYDGVEIEIHDPDTGAELPPRRRGEVWIRSAGATSGYWNRPEATAALSPRPGWIRTGDVGMLDQNGYLFLTDRLTDLIITGGENVYPAEVERVLITHPEVHEVAVIGVPDDRWGEAVTAFVVRTADSRLTAGELDDWARDRIAGFRRPKHVVFLDELPRNAAGKVLRRVLRKEFETA
jgi:acyl-CoA synthetase (AMP-forming)/AMP-acid ligase II